MKDRFTVNPTVKHLQTGWTQQNLSDTSRSVARSYVSGSQSLDDWVGIRNA